MLLDLHIADNESEPLYKLVKGAIIGAIRERVLKPGQTLPSSRQMAEILNISRPTIVRAYEDLTSAGWITIYARGKTVVSRDLSQLLNSLSRSTDASISVQPEWSDFAKRLRKHAVDDNRPPPTHRSAPIISELPVTLWRQSLNKAVRDIDSDQMLWSDSFGYAPLRQAVKDLLARTRAVRCDQEQVAIHARSSGGIDLICRLLFEPGAPVAVEDPGSELIRALFGSHGFQIQPIEVDQHGLRVDKLREQHPAPRLIYVSPSRNEPSGCVMSLERRRELIAYAAGAGAFILEDDFDCEYRYGEKPLPSLQSLDAHGCVIYRYNFWKVMYPLVKLSVNVLPHSLLADFCKLNEVLFRDVPMVEQAALANFIQCGHFERFARKRHRLCASRRAALMLELTRQFGKRIQLFDISGGTDARVVFDESLPPEELLQAASDADLPMLSTSPKYCQRQPLTNEFTINFSNITEQQISISVKKFAALVLGSSVVTAKAFAPAVY